MFRNHADFEAFERVMVEAHQRRAIRILSYKGQGNPHALIDARQIVDCRR